MIKILLYGANGTMGKAVAKRVKDSNDFAITAGVDSNMTPDFGDSFFPIFNNIYDCNVPADIIIDFSTAEAVPAALDYAVLKRLPIIVCTTALSEETMQKIHSAAKNIPVLRSANMSIGINLLADLLKKYATVLNDAGFDIEIIEKHHRNKIDAPSGTALMLADTINSASANKFNYVYDRKNLRYKRSNGEIGISSLRGGTIAGEHDIVFAGDDEIVEFSHRALSNDVFAKGALLAAKFLAFKSPGLYSMEDIFN
jgi:4-hydroxy-tetrahydrodipicolinate reductase